MPQSEWDEIMWVRLCNLPGRPTRSVRPRPGPWASALLLAVAFGVFEAPNLLVSEAAEPPRPPAPRLPRHVRAFSVATSPFREGIAGVVRASFSSDGRLLAYGKSAQLSVWDLHKQKEVSYLISHDECYLQQVAFTPDSKQVVLTGYDSGRKKGEGPAGPIWEEGRAETRFWDFTAKKKVGRILKGVGGVFAFSPDGKHLAICVLDKPPADHTSGVSLYDVTTGKKERHYRISAEIMWAVVFDPVGHCYAVLDDGKVQGLYDLEKGKMRFAVGEHSRVVPNLEAAHLSPDGKRLLTAHANGSTARLWDVETGKEVAHCKPVDPWFESGMSQACFVPKQRYILLCDQDHIHAWDPAANLVLWSLRAKHFPEPRRSRIIHNLVVSPDGKRFATISNDSRGDWVDLWEFPPSDR